MKSVPASSWLPLILILCAASVGFAHKPSDSYLRIYGGSEPLSIEWDIALRDLEILVGLDANQDGEITWGELKSKKDDVLAHALSRLSLTVDGQPCQLQPDEMLVTRHGDGTYAVLRLKTDAAGDTRLLEVNYHLLFDDDPTHRGLVMYRNGDAMSTHVLSPASPRLVLRAGDFGFWRTFVQYVREGVWHIWIGFDHILFLLSLLLPAVFVYRDRDWQPVEAFRPAAASVLKIVTVFTIAHSITLWLAVMEYVQLPGPWVEATIAFSIVITALHNLLPVVRLSGWGIAFGFGFIHGFGFANVLTELGLQHVALGISLLGFNVGVELGQIAIVLVFFPLAYGLRRTSFYRRVVFTGGSLLILLIAAVWTIERVLNVQILGL